MAALQSMTLTERMNTINGDGVHEYTFQEACNRWLKINMGAYSGISLHKYTPEEFFSIVRDKDFHEKTLTELINEMGLDDAHEFTATEGLNEQADISLAPGI